MRPACLGGWATVTNRADADWAVVSGTVHAPAAANATVLDIPSTMGPLGLISASTNELDMFRGFRRLQRAFAWGRFVAFNTVTGGSGVAAREVLLRQIAAIRLRRRTILLHNQHYPGRLAGLAPRKFGDGVGGTASVDTQGYIVPLPPASCAHLPRLPHRHTW